MVGSVSAGGASPMTAKRDSPEAIAELAQRVDARYQALCAQWDWADLFDRGWAGPSLSVWLSGVLLGVPALLIGWWWAWVGWIVLPPLVVLGLRWYNWRQWQRRCLVQAFEEVCYGVYSPVDGPYRRYSGW